MDLADDKEVCGTCGDWMGKRERLEDGTFRVSPSARGRCQRLSKPKPPHGGCDQWKKTEEAGDG